MTISRTNRSSDVRVRSLTFSSVPQFTCASLSRHFGNSQLGTNLLWLTIAALLNTVFVGQIAVFGYGYDLIQAKAGRPENSTPDIDSNRLGDYLQHGIWPFVVQMLVSLGLTVVMAIPSAVILGVTMGIGGAIGGEETAGVGGLLALPLLLIVAIPFSVFFIAILVRAIACQDFQASFDFSWAWHFTKTMFWEIVLSGLIFGVLSMLASLVGLLASFVGTFVAAGVVSGAFMHLLAQWYEIYLTKCGIPVSPPDEGVIDAQIV